MQFAKLSVSLFALAAIGAASPAPQAQTLIRIGHAGNEDVASSSSIESAVGSSSQVEPTPEESPARVSSSDEDSLENSGSSEEETASSEEETASQKTGSGSSSEENALSSEEESANGTSTVIVSGEDQIVSGERSESGKDSESSGADSFRGASMVTLAVAGGVSLMLAAF
ncbi:hypothetical protein J3B02_003653 [Coemansia erecta]|nr:hypothetical protein J3B02_003653 [Coemansia erecta]KAJ2871245.1 hypothetical protein FB639_004499 [Coemansia asiatica]